MSSVPRSDIFDDIYFSPQDGCAETRHVFLEGNSLPQAWRNIPHFTICETGFGTGLNFLMTAQLFQETAYPDQILEFISFEKYPLSAAAIEAALRPFGLPHLDRLHQVYPLPVPGWHRLAFNNNLFLTLIIDDVNDSLPQLKHLVNAWFLDGFAPAKNPEMWSETVFQSMERLSAPDSTFSTFTAAGAVKRGLKSAGFEIEKAPGFGRKREMLKGRFRS